MKNIIVGLAILFTSNSFAEAEKTRVDFSDMQIRGQTKNADTVYMYDRGLADQKSQIKVRVDYRKEISSKPIL